MPSTAEHDLLQAYALHEPWLRTAVHARLGDLDEVDEVMQEVALAAANQSVKSQAVERVGPWLYRVALRQVLLFRRKAGRRRKLIDGFQRSMTQPTQRTPLQFLLSQERGRWVRSALSEMSERDRQLLMLKYVDSLTYTEIAQRLGVSASSVQSRLHRARAALKNQLIGNEPGADYERSSN
jgi:RNA polymerase sigma factor (sigma-70 family)